MAVHRLVRAEAPYMQIARSISERITSGELSPGDRLPTGAQIQQDWGVSRATANKVATHLRTAGVAYTEPGIGLIVAPLRSTTEVTPGAMWRRMLGGEPIYLPNERSERTVGSASGTAVPDLVWTALDADPSSELVYRRRLLYRDDRPCGVVTSWFAPWLSDQVTARLRDDSAIPEGTPAYLSSQLGRELTGHRHVIGIVRADGDMAAELSVEVDAPLLRIADTIEADGTPIEVGMYYCPEAPVIVTTESGTAL